MTRLQSIRAIAMIAGTIVLLGCEQTAQKTASNSNAQEQASTQGANSATQPAPAESVPASPPTVGEAELDLPATNPMSPEPRRINWPTPPRSA